MTTEQLDRNSADTPIQTYRVLAVQFEPVHIETVRAYEATALGEALLMAERDDAGQGGSAITYGVLPEYFAIARAEGIEFNEADGLLV